ncbi:AMP-binding protein [Sporosarcina sp. P13]|uniref:AMP-binding enzyme n=1 Tax=Sporosarcina sp. P13 TaxID=2048263 RepID=UPI0035167280
MFRRGFRKGDRMAIMLPNSVEYVIAYFSVQRLGGIVCQVNPMYQPFELDSILQDSKAEWFISYKEQQDKLENLNIARKLVVVVADRESADKDTMYKWIREENNKLPEIEINPDKIVAVLQYTGGYNIYPGEIEQVLYEHHAVLEVCVYGVPDPYRGETVKAAIVLRKSVSVTKEEIMEWCTVRVARYKVPRIIDFRSHLPKIAVGKILRRSLVEEDAKKHM